jgi:small subunit ribosomal protein S14
MAKKSKIAKAKKIAATVDKYAAVRAEYKATRQLCGLANLTAQCQPSADA